MNEDTKAIMDAIASLRAEVAVIRRELTDVRGNPHSLAEGPTILDRISRIERKLGAN